MALHLYGRSLNLYEKKSNELRDSLRNGKQLLKRSSNHTSFTASFQFSFLKFVLATVHDLPNKICLIFFR